MSDTLASQCSSNGSTSSGTISEYVLALLWGIEKELVVMRNCRGSSATRRSLLGNLVGVTLRNLKRWCLQGGSCGKARRRVVACDSAKLQGGAGKGVVTGFIHVKCFRYLSPSAKKSGLTTWMVPDMIQGVVITSATKQPIKKKQP